MKRAVVLLSGGLDSATTLAVAKAEGYELYALTLDYGQRHGRELESAGKVARALGVKRHIVLKLDLGAFGGSALTSSDLDVPLDRKPGRMGVDVPATYVPARNLVLLSVALSWAEALGAKSIFIGANAVDYSGYPDCRREFLESFERIAALCTRTGIRGRPIVLRFPLIDLSKGDIVRKGLKLGVPFELTWSCYLGGKRPCGRCDSCLLRGKGFREAGAEDPLLRRGAGK